MDRGKRIYLFRKNGGLSPLGIIVLVMVGIIIFAVFLRLLPLIFTFIAIIGVVVAIQYILIRRRRR